jgi:hypothetical protein
MHIPAWKAFDMRVLGLSACFGVAASVLVAPSTAESANYIVWQGDAVILSATPQCSAQANERTKIARGTVLLSVVRPASLASNGNDSRISFNHDRQSEFALDLAGGLTISGTGTYAAFGVTTSAVIKANVGGNYRAFALTPPFPGVSTLSLALTGTIDNFMFVTGCTVTFRASYTHRV